MKNLVLFFTCIFIVLDLTLSQTELDQSKNPINTGARYVSGGDGIIRMYVNIWGHVRGPGRILVDEGIDLATLFSLTGGPMKGANLKKIRVYHEYPDKDGNIVHIINLTSFPRLVGVIGESIISTTFFLRIANNSEVIQLTTIFAELFKSL